MPMFLLSFGFFICKDDMKRLTNAIEKIVLSILVMYIWGLPEETDRTHMFDTLNTTYDEILRITASYGARYERFIDERISW